MPLDNRIIVASAGSGKTTLIVDDACGVPGRRAAMITYTNNGREGWARLLRRDRSPHKWMLDFGPTAVLHLACG